MTRAGKAWLLVAALSSTLAIVPAAGNPAPSAWTVPLWQFDTGG